MTPTATLMTLTLLLAPAMAWGRPAAEPTDLQPPPQNQGPPWTYEESQAFNAIMSEPNLAKRISLGEEFLSKFPQSALASLIKRTLVGLYIQSQNLNKAFEVAESYFVSNNEKYADAFKLVMGPPLEKAGAQLPTKPTEDFQLLVFLVSAANQAARANNYTFDDQALKYAQAALALLNLGDVPPTIVPATWKGNENTTEATLHQTIGLVKMHRQQYEEALASLQKAGQLDPSDPVTFYLQGEALRTGKYAQLRKAVEETRQKYDDLNKQLKQIEDQVNQINAELEKLSKLRETPHNKARIEELSKQGQELNDKGKATSDHMQQLSDQIDQQVAQTDQVVDQMIQVYAKTVALSDRVPQLQQTARQYLESYYKYRHQGSLEGLEELIRKVKSERT